MNAQSIHLGRPPEAPPSFGVRQSSPAFESRTGLQPACTPGNRQDACATKAPEGWRSPKRWRVPEVRTALSALLSLVAADVSPLNLGSRQGSISLPRLLQLMGLALVTCVAVSAPATELRIGQATVLLGEAVSLPVTLAGSSASVGAQFDLSFDSSLATLNGFAIGAASSGHIMDHEQTASNHGRILVYSMTNAALSPGTLVWLSFTVPTNAPDGVIPLTLSNAILAKAIGQPVEPLTEISGALIVSSAERLIAEPSGSGGELRTTIIGLPGRVFTLQGGPDLFHWANLGVYSNETGTLVLTNPPPAGRDDYFYRTVLRTGTNSPAVPSPSLGGVELLPHGKVRIQLNSTAGSVWRVEGSPDLSHWGNYGVVTNPSGTLPITNTPYMKPGVYFYRVAQP